MIDNIELKTITLVQYQKWKRTQAIFDALRGVRFGRSFCNRFGIVDNLLFYNAFDQVRADQYIRDTYLKS